MLLVTGNAVAQQGSGRPLPLSVTSSPIPNQVQLPLRIRVAPEVQAAKLIYRVHAVYPRDAAAVKATGTVVLHAIISTDGSIQRLDFVSGPKIFEKSAKDAVRQWRYRPSLIKEQPVEVDTIIRLTFLLDESGTANATSPPEQKPSSPKATKISRCRCRSQLTQFPQAKRNYHWREGGPARATACC
jgi:TonB family protein